MKVNLKKLRKARQFSEEFKRSIVDDFEKGRLSVQQLCRLHHLSSVSVYQWIHKFSTFNEKGFRIIEMKSSSSQKVKELERRIKELEQMVGQKQIMIEYLEKMMEIAKEELDIDIKKNFGTPPSAGSGKTNKK